MATTIVFPDITTAVCDVTKKNISISERREKNGHKC